MNTEKVKYKNGFEERKNRKNMCGKEKEREKRREKKKRDLVPKKNASTSPILESVLPCFQLFSILATLGNSFLFLFSYTHYPIFCLFFFLFFSVS